MFSAHPLIRIHRKAAEVIDALTNEAVLELAWEDHGFRGPRGIIGKARTQLLQLRLIDRIDAALPDAPATMARRDRLTAQDLSCLSTIFSEHRKRSCRRACALRAEPEPAVHRTQNVGVVVGPIALAVGRFGFDPFVRGRKIADVGFLTRTDHDVG